MSKISKRFMWFLPGILTKKVKLHGKTECSFSFKIDGLNLVF